MIHGKTDPGEAQADRCRLPSRTYQVLTNCQIPPRGSIARGVLHCHGPPDAQHAPVRADDGQGRASGSADSQMPFLEPPRRSKGGAPSRHPPSPIACSSTALAMQSVTTSIRVEDALGRKLRL